MKQLPLICAWIVCLACTVHARIGDTESSLKRRLTADRFAVELRGEGAESLITRGPLKRFLDLAEELEDAFEYRIYMKSADGERLSTTDAKAMSILDGWIYTAMFLRGSVVAESYERRKSEGDSRINPHEKKGLLIINQESASWTELNGLKLPDGTPVEGLTEYDFMRSDEKAFAKFARNHAIFIRKELDERLREQRSVRNAEIDEENKGALQMSISGF